MMRKIGLIAGKGELPEILAYKMKENGIKVIGFALSGITDPSFGYSCHRVHWLKLGQLKKFLLLLFTEQIREITMIGKIDKSILFDRSVKEDKDVERILKSLKDNADYTILEKITKEFKKIGVKVVDGSVFMEDFLPEKGVLTKRKLLDAEKDDVSFGYRVAKELARLDIGQCVVVKDKTIVSVEAMEGTDMTINRAGKICGDGFVVVKVARPKQDMRFDVPCVGIQTIRVIAENKGRVLAIESRKTYLIDRTKCVKAADKNGISIVVV